MTKDIVTFLSRVLHDSELNMSNNTAIISLNYELKLSILGQKYNRERLRMDPK